MILFARVEPEIERQPQAEHQIYGSVGKLDVAVFLVDVEEVGACQLIGCAANDAEGN